MKNIKDTFKKLSKILVLVFVLATSAVSAQTGFGDDVDDAGPGIPLDGGLSLLLAGAAAYGVKKLRDHKNE